MSINGNRSRVICNPSMRTVSACSASGGPIRGNDSGQRGNSNGCVVVGNSRVAPDATSASSRSVRPSNGRNAGSTTTRCAVKTIRPEAQARATVTTQRASSARGVSNRTPCSVSGPDNGPSARCQVSVVPAGNRATIWRSSTSRPPMVARSHQAAIASSATSASVPNAERSATRRANARRAALRASSCSGVSGTPLTDRRRC